MSACAYLEGQGPGGNWRPLRVGDAEHQALLGFWWRRLRRRQDSRATFTVGRAKTCRAGPPTSGPRNLRLERSEDWRSQKRRRASRDLKQAGRARGFARSPPRVLSRGRGPHPRSVGQMLAAGAGRLQRLAAALAGAAPGLQAEPALDPWWQEFGMLAHKCCQRPCRDLCDPVLLAFVPVVR